MVVLKKSPTLHFKCGTLPQRFVTFCVTFNFKSLCDTIIIMTRARSVHVKSIQ